MTDTIKLASDEDREGKPEAQIIGIDQDLSKFKQKRELNEQMTNAAQQQAEFTEDDKQETRGRKKVEIDPELVYKLAECHCTLKEIAYIIGVTENTLRNRVSTIIERGYSAGKMRLRKAQYNKALEGNPVMLIWLGKNILGQKDDPSTGEEDLPLPWKD
jgi:hypothetical protein